MRKVLKSYLKLFFSKWLETLILLIFIVMLLATVIGFSSAPIQLQQQISTIARKSETPDFYLQEKDIYPSDNFLETYFLNQTTFDLGDGVNIPLPLDENGQEIKIVDDAKLKDIDNPQKKLNYILTSFSIMNDGYVNSENEIEEVEGYTNFVFTPEYCRFLLSLGQTFSMRDWMLENILQHYSATTIMSQAVTNDKLQYDNIRQGVRLTTFYDTNISSTSIKKTMTTVLTEGHEPTAGEIVLAPIFKSHGFKLGDHLKIRGFDFKISGFGTKYDLAVSGSQLGSTSEYALPIYLTVNDYNKIKKLSTFVPYTYHIYRVYDESANNEARTMLQKIRIICGDGWDPLRENNDFFGISAIENFTLICMVFIILSCVMLFISVLFIYFVLRRDITTTKRQIGILKAFGFRKSELAWVFVVKTFVIIFLGCLIGFAASIGVQDYNYSIFHNLTYLTLQKVFVSWWFLFGIFLIIPTFFSLFSFAMLFVSLNESPLSLISDSVNRERPSRVILVLKYILFPFAVYSWILAGINNYAARRYKFFKWRLRYQITRRGIVKFVWTVGLVAFTIIALFAQLTAKSILSSVSYNAFSDYNSSFEKRYNLGKLYQLEMDRNQSGYKIKRSDWISGDAHMKSTDLQYVDTALTSIDDYYKNNLDNDKLNLVDQVISYMIEKFSSLKKSDNNYTPAEVAMIGMLNVPLDSDYEKNIDELASDYEQVNENKFAQLLINWKDTNNIAKLSAVTKNGSGKEVRSGFLLVTWLSLR